MGEYPRGILSLIITIQTLIVSLNQKSFLSNANSLLQCNGAHPYLALPEIKINSVTLVSKVRKRYK